MFFPPTDMLRISAMTGFGIHNDTKGKLSRTGWHSSNHARRISARPWKFCHPCLWCPLRTVRPCRFSDGCDTVHAGDASGENLPGSPAFVAPSCSGVHGIPPAPWHNANKGFPQPQSSSGEIIKIRGKVKSEEIATHVLMSYCIAAKTSASIKSVLTNPCSTEKLTCDDDVLNS